MRDDQQLIVIIDDDDSICRALTRLLRAQGFRVRTYSTPHAYLDESDALSPSCALIDIRMPDIDGLSLLHLIRRNGIEVPVGAAIDEAIELARTYAGDEAAPFVNGGLGRIARRASRPSPDASP